MNSEELGRKIHEARLHNGLTQEELAEKCDINVRTVQRIEKGEVIPRPGNLKMLGDILGENFNDYWKEGAASINNFWVVLLHLSSLMPLVIVPVLIYYLKKDELPEIENHWKHVANFQITMCIFLFGSAMLVFIGIGVLFLVFLGPVICIITLFNTMKVLSNQSYSYPAFTFIK